MSVARLWKEEMGTRKLPQPLCLCSCFCYCACCREIEMMWRKWFQAPTFCTQRRTCVRVSARRRAWTGSEQQELVKCSTCCVLRFSNAWLYIDAGCVVHVSARRRAWTGSEQQELVKCSTCCVLRFSNAWLYIDEGCAAFFGLPGQLNKIQCGVAFCVLCNLVFNTITK